MSFIPKNAEKIIFFSAFFVDGIPKDRGNDIEILEFAGRKDVKKVAMYVTNYIDNDGIYLVLTHFKIIFLKEWYIKTEFYTE